VASRVPCQLIESISPLRENLWHRRGAAPDATLQARRASEIVHDPHCIRAQRGRPYKGAHHPRRRPDGHALRRRSQPAMSAASAFEVPRAAPGSEAEPRTVGEAQMPTVASRAQAA